MFLKFHPSEKIASYVAFPPPDPQNLNLHSLIMGKLSSGHRNNPVHKAKNIYYVVLQKTNCWPLKKP